MLVRLAILFAICVVPVYSAQCSVTLNVFLSKKDCSGSRDGTWVLTGDSNGECLKPTATGGTAVSTEANKRAFKWNSSCTQVQTFSSTGTTATCTGTAETWFKEGTLSNCGIPGTSTQNDGHSYQCDGTGKICTFGGSGITVPTGIINNGAAMIVPQFALVLLVAVASFLMLA
eukprot:NODE_559_length_744_cov_59.419773_g550_i0.p1 GENE.NODE_559_length_744_cov_59.419773_g550_i0~~NODE_559_length_744_cov_59.419773_g550_i0.p1  ORF type:complete len:173 (+),score=33.29 NODE_559_length_744_cov_59.419773_g550_i0:65-583(+)